MAIRDLTEAEQAQLLACLHAAVDGSFFEEWEFQTLFGLKREEVRAIAASWPHLNEADEAVDGAISNSLANLFSYPHGRDDEIFARIGLRKAELIDLLQRWRQVTSR